MVGYKNFLKIWLSEPKTEKNTPIVQVALSPKPVVQEKLEDEKENIPVSELKQLEQALFREELPEEGSSESEAISSSDSVSTFLLQLFIKI